jgi:hypothetical protein
LVSKRKCIKWKGFDCYQISVKVFIANFHGFLTSGSEFVAKLFQTLKEGAKGLHIQEYEVSIKARAQVVFSYL